MFVTLFLVLMGYIVYFNAIQSKDIINSPYNARQDSMADRVVRGNIVDKNGEVLAHTNVAEDGSEYRNYPYEHIYAHVIGYADQGKSGLESMENFVLLTSNAFFLEKIKNEFQDQKNQGDTVVTTLDTNLQQAAYNALGATKGAVVVTEPSTGKVLAMVSKPDYNPNTIVADWDWLNTDVNSALLNRATQGLYAPGSIFKLVTTLEYMREQPAYGSYSYVCQGTITQDGTTIPCANGAVHGQVDLPGSIAYSCNTSFSNIGLSLDVNAYQDTAKDLLFNGKLPSLLPYSKSAFVLQESDTSADYMMTAMGQGKTQVSPYHMALLTSAIANGGTLMKPYLVDSITNYTGSIIKKTTPEKYKTLLSAEEASQLKTYMIGVSEYGTGAVMNGAGYTSAGKTGTAEYGSDPSQTHSWYVGFLNVDNPEIAISVIAEESNGSVDAVNIAKQVFDAYYY